MGKGKGSPLDHQMIQSNLLVVMTLEMVSVMPSSVTRHPLSSLTFLSRIETLTKSYSFTDMAKKKVKSKERREQKALYAHFNFFRVRSLAAA